MISHAIPCYSTLFHYIPWQYIACYPMWFQAIPLYSMTLYCMLFHRCILYIFHYIPQYLIWYSMIFHDAQFVRTIVIKHSLTRLAQKRHTNSTHNCLLRHLWPPAQVQYSIGLASEWRLPTWSTKLVGASPSDPKVAVQQFPFIINQRAHIYIYIYIWPSSRTPYTGISTY